MVPEESHVLEKWRARISDALKHPDKLLGNSLCTQTKKWGLVWRVDVWSKTSYLSLPPHIQRYIFWQLPGEESYSSSSRSLDRDVEPPL